MDWSQNDNFLVSSSADGSAKVWDLTNKGEGNPDAKNYTENDALFFVDQLLHPSFVYAAKIYPDAQMVGTRDLIIATACFDQKIRIWKVSTV